MISKIDLLVLLLDSPLVGVSLHVESTLKFWDKVDIVFIINCGIIAQLQWVIRVCYQRELEKVPYASDISHNNVTTYCHDPNVTTNQTELSSISYVFLMGLGTRRYTYIKAQSVA